ncbi:MAG: YihY/virulence factor BrkB family protein [Elusimicrobia bacterium]|nr:YihY/virulence factor BrkB family protein [Elusimicrobiota bacterium]
MDDKAKELARRSWATVRLTARRFNEIDGGQRASAFAYSAFFSLFPLILLFVAAATLFIDRSAAGNLVISYVERFVPITGEMRDYVFNTVTRVVRARGQAGAVAVAMLVWVAAQFFTTLIQAANRAWGTTGANWWKLPLKSLALLGITSAAVLAGIGVPLLGKLFAGFFRGGFFLPAAYKFWLFVLPWLIVFVSLTFFYKVAPHRRTRYAEVWFSALCATLLLNAAQTLFVLYLKHIAALSALYGAFGGIMALLLWIYVSGVIFIFCACLCAAQAATRPAR